MPVILDARHPTTCRCAQPAAPVPVPWSGVPQDLPGMSVDAQVRRLDRKPAPVARPGKLGC